MRATAILIVATAVSVASQAQPYFTDVFPPEEFAVRRRAGLDEIGQAVAIVHGAPEMAAEVRFRQSNRFFYRTGVEVPRATLLLDGRSKSSTLFLPPPRRERDNGPELGPGPVAASIEPDDIERLMKEPGLSDLVAR